MNSPGAEDFEGRPGGRKRFVIEVAVFLIALVPALLWPVDTLWTNDEPRLIANAWHANHAWHPAWGGLWGNFGIRYGPFPTQFYQLLLWLTSDPFILAMLRAGVCASVSAISFLWLARSLSFSPWFAGAALAAPPVVFFHRLIWDASFAMPLGVLALAALAAFLRRGRDWHLVLSIVCTAVFATVHPQDLPLAVSIGGVIAWKHRNAVRRQRKPLLIALVIFLALNGAYFGQLAQLVVTRLSDAVVSGYPNGKSPAIAILAPFLAGNLLAAQPFPETLETPDSWLRLLTAVVYPLCWAGLAIAGWQAWRYLRSGRASFLGRGVEAASSSVIAREQVVLVAFAAAVMQGLLFFAMRVPSGAQYFFGTFAVHVFLAWLAVESVPWKSLRPVIAAAYGLAGIWLSIHGMWSVHRDGTAIEPFQPGLGSQVKLARILNETGAQAVLTDVSHLQRYSQGVRALRLLLPHSDRTGGPKLLVRYQAGPGVRRGVFEVSAAGDPSTLPAGFLEVDVTPLPEGWYPPPSK